MVFGNLHAPLAILLKHGLDHKWAEGILEKLRIEKTRMIQRTIEVLQIGINIDHECIFLIEFTFVKSGELFNIKIHC